MKMKIGLSITRLMLIGFCLLFPIVSVEAQAGEKFYFDEDGTSSSASSGTSYIVYQISKKDKNLISVAGFYANSSKKFESNYFLKKNLESIDFKNFYNPSFWDDAVKDGEYKEWYKNGALKEQGGFKMGHKNGLYRHWYENGNLMSKQNLIDGKEEGEVTGYYEEGGLKMKYYASDGVINGELSEWYENGRKMKAVQMKDNKMIGEVQTWDQKGTEIKNDQN